MVWFKKYINENFKMYLQKEVWTDLKFLNHLEKVPFSNRNYDYYELIETTEKLYSGKYQNSKYKKVSSELQEAYESIVGRINEKLDKILLEKSA